LWIRIGFNADPDPAFYLNADLDPVHILKLNFYTKNTLIVGNRSENIRTLDQFWTISVLHISVADPGCLSRIPVPDFYPSRIPDPGSRIPDPKTATKDRGEQFFFVKTFFVATNFTKLNTVLFYF
jgi:hypothetical protein